MALLVVPAVLGWFYLEQTVEPAMFLLLAALSLGLAAANLWDQQRINRMKALEEVEAARAMMEKGQFRGALNRLEDALRYDPGCFDVRVARAEVYRIQRSYDLARRELMEAIELWPDSYTAHFALGLTYLEDKKLYPAISEFRRSIQINPRYSEPYFILAQAYELSGEKEKARDAYQRFLEVAREEPSAGARGAASIERARERLAELQ